MDDAQWLKDALDKLDNKVDKLDQRLSDINERHVANSANLSEHIYRTELNEENIAMLREDFKPIQKHVVMVSGVLKAIGIISTVVGILTGVIKVLQSFNII